MRNIIDLNLVASWFDNRCPIQQRPKVEAYLAAGPGLSEMISSLLGANHSLPEKSLSHIRKKVLKRFCGGKSNSEMKK